MVTIVTDVHYRMSLALIRDLSQAGVELVTCERASHRNNPASPALGAASRYAGRHVWLPEDGWLDALYSLCRELGEEYHCRPALLPVGATTLAALAQERARFDSVCGLLTPTVDQLELMNSKERVSALAKGLGVPVPEAYSRDPQEEIADFARRLPLPAVVKPVCGEKLGLAAAGRYVIAKTAGEAEAAYRRYRDLSGEEPVVQTYLTGAGLGCSVLCREGQVVAGLCHRRIREYPVTGGPSSCCVSVERPELMDAVKRLVAATGYSGLAMFEFKEDGAGNAHLLEVNPRIWGTFPLTRVTGSGLPLLWCTLAWNAGNPDSPEPVPACAPAVGRKMIFAASDLSAALGYARRGQWGAPLRALADLLDPRVRDGVFEWSDPRPALQYLRSLLRKEQRG